MKQGIHPEYRPVIFLDTSANHSFLTRSAIDTKGRETMKWEDGKEYPVVKVEVSSESHSFYTGKQKIVDTAGRVEKFKRRYTKKPADEVTVGGDAAPAQAFPPLRLPLPPTALALVALAFVLPGLAGHDLWKSHDAIGIGIVHDMAKSGDLVVPRVPAGSGSTTAAVPLGGARFRQRAPVRDRVPRRARASRAALSCSPPSGSSTARPRLGHTRIGARASASAAMLLLLGCVGPPRARARGAARARHARRAVRRARRARRTRRRTPAAAGLAFGVALGSQVPPRRAGWRPRHSTLAVVAAHFVHAPSGARAAALPFSASRPWSRSSSAGALAAGALPARAGGLRAMVGDLIVRPQADIGANLRYFLATASWFAWPAWPLALWARWSLRRRWREPRLFVPALGRADHDRRC